MSTKIELNKTAKRMAQYANESLMSQHRGLMPTGSDMYVLFGNDGFRTDIRSQMEAKAVSEAAQAEGCPVSDIQTDKSGLTWAIAVIAGRKNATQFSRVMCLTWLEESYKKDEMSKITLNG